MAGARFGLIAPATAALGRLVARYSRAAINPDRVEIILEEKPPPKPTLWICWHEANLLALALHAHVTGRAGMAFVPPGLNGAAMRGWLEELGITPVPLAADARRGLGLRQMETALGAGKDVLIAVDGPSGPRHKVSPGAMWLAHSSGTEIRPIGASAAPAFRLPRWDRLIVPLPNARIAVVIGAALGARQGEAQSFTAEIPATLDRLMGCARMATHPGLK
jgi:lysophospholipid acyltransferase (LPLAT)-like uncharacterized protein